VHSLQCPQAKESQGTPHTNALPWIFDARAETCNAPCDFVARNDRKTNKRKIAVSKHKVAAAHAAGVDLDSYLTITGRRQGAFFILNPALCFSQNGCRHRAKHPPFSTASLSRKTEREKCILT